MVIVTPEQMNRMKVYIPQNLRTIREAMGLTHEQLADKCRMARTTIQRIEAGGIPNMLSAYKLIDGLKLEVNIL